MGSAGNTGGIDVLSIGKNHPVLFRQRFKVSYLPFDAAGQQQIVAGEIDHVGTFGQGQSMMYRPPARASP